MIRPVAISDHALVRFLQRGAGVDIDAMKSAVSASLDRAHRAAGRIGASDYTVRADGLVFVVRDGVLVTVNDGPRRR